MLIRFVKNSNGAEVAIDHAAITVADPILTGEVTMLSVKDYGLIEVRASFEHVLKLVSEARILEKMEQ